MVSSVDGVFCGVFCGLKETIRNYGEGLGLIACFGGGCVDECLFVETDGDDLSVFEVFGLSGFVVVFAVEVVADPEKARCVSLVDDEFCGISTHVVDGSRDWGQTIALGII